MKIGLLCDMHISNQDSAQWDFFMRAAEQMEKDKIQTVVNLGDTTSFGEYDIFCEYKKQMKAFRCYTLLGNSDVRDAFTAPFFEKEKEAVRLEIGCGSMFGIHTPYGRIEKEDRNVLRQMRDGDVLLLHHSPGGLCEESCELLTKLANKKEITIIHAHSHKWLDYTLGKSRVICIRALDPDKSIGDFPCITYYDTERKELEERCFTVSDQTVMHAKKYFGISCTDNLKDVGYAARHDVYAIELKWNGMERKPDSALTTEIERWRDGSNKYLSIHMPNLYWKNGEIEGAEQWRAALEYANAVKVDGLTMHPPRAKLREMRRKEVWDEFLKLYVYAAQSVKEGVNIGIENLHMGESEKEEARGFGYTPQEVNKWIDSINTSLKKDGRVGHTLDVGHARNNGILSERFPISRWYEIMGKHTAAYHIHQVTPLGDELLNHNAIEHWFGPMISYVSFFYAWEKGRINRVPIFLEVRGCENYEKSITAFDKTFAAKKY